MDKTTEDQILELQNRVNLHTQVLAGLCQALGEISDAMPPHVRVKLDVIGDSVLELIDKATND